MVPTARAASVRTLPASLSTRTSLEDGEDMQPDSSDLYRAHGAYVEARGRALGTSTLWLRLQARWLGRKFDNLSDDKRAELVAIRGVLAGRGVAV